MRIQHNIAAANAHRQLGGNNTAVGKNLEKLSSGFKINRAGDDAAGLAISEKMRAQIKGLETASTNAEDGVSLIQTAEGALTEVHSMLNRMVELATQSSNGTYTDADRGKIQDEVTALKSEIDRIATGTNFNGINLLDGSMGTGTTGGSATVAADVVANTGAFKWEVSGGIAGTSVTINSVAKGTTDGVTASWAGGALTLQIGGDSGDKITQEMVNTALRNASGTPENAKDLKVTLKSDIVFSADSGVKAAVSAITTADAKKAEVAMSASGGTVFSTKAGTDTRTLKFDAAAASTGVTIDAATGNVTVGIDASKSYTSSQINQMLSDAGAEMTVQFDGAKTGTAAGGSAAAFNSTAVALAGGTGLASGGGLNLQVGDTNDTFQKVTVSVGNMSSASLGIGGIDLSTETGAGAAIQKIKDAINTVSSTRGNLGALQNRLEHTVNNLGVTTENMTAAESRIRDVDMAKEMMDFTKNNILTQAAQSMLAQANQLPQGVLQLLK